VREFVLIFIGFVLGDAMGVAGIVDLGHKVAKLFGF